MDINMVILIMTLQKNLKLQEKIFWGMIKILKKTAQRNNINNGNFMKIMEIANQPKWNIQIICKINTII